MRITLTCLSILLAGCGTRGEDSNKAAATVPALTLAVTPLELTAKAALDKRDKDRQVINALEKRVKSAMEVALIDPFSAQYRTLRSGRNGAICGQVNGKNRMGAYVGFRDFVLGKDGKTVWFSQQSDGVETELYSGFAEAFVSACASRVQVARYRAATAPDPYYGGYDSDPVRGAADAASSAARDAATSM